MKQILLIGFFTLTLTFGISAQQMLNPGFENWEDAGTVSDEPVNWSSIKTSDGGETINNFAPVVWFQSSDAHTGQYSVQLTNIETIVIATGIVTNGRVHADFDPEKGYVFTEPSDPQWNTVFTTRPDSVVIWAKYFPVGTDTAQVKVLLHKGEGTLPPTPENEGNQVGFTQLNIYGTYDTWTRFASPIEYFTTENPEYILVVLTAGAGTQPTAESTAFYDDILMVYGPSSTTDLLPNTKNLLFFSENIIWLDRLPDDYLNQASFEIYNMQGMNIFKTQVTGDQVNVGKLNLPPALYVVKISGRERVYSQKMFLN